MKILTIFFFIAISLFSNEIKNCKTYNISEIYRWGFGRDFNYLNDYLETENANYFVGYFGQNANSGFKPNIQSDYFKNRIKDPYTAIPIIEKRDKNNKLIWSRDLFFQNALRTFYLHYGKLYEYEGDIFLVYAIMDHFGTEGNEASIRIMRFNEYGILRKEINVVTDVTLISSINSDMNENGEILISYEHSTKENNSSGRANYFIKLYDSELEPILEKDDYFSKYSHSDGTFLYDIKLHQDKIYLSGYTNDYFFDLTDTNKVTLYKDQAFIRVLNKEGDIISSKIIISDENSYPFFNNMNFDDDENLYFFVYIAPTKNAQYEDRKAHLIKMNTDYKIEWMKKVNIPFNYFIWQSMFNGDEFTLIGQTYQQEEFSDFSECESYNKNFEDGLCILEVGLDYEIKDKFILPGLRNPAYVRKDGNRYKIKAEGFKLVDYDIKNLELYELDSDNYEQLFFALEKQVLDIKSVNQDTICKGDTLILNLESNADEEIICDIYLNSDNSSNRYLLKKDFTVSNGLVKVEQPLVGDFTSGDYEIELEYEFDNIIYFNGNNSIHINALIAPDITIENETLISNKENTKWYYESDFEIPISEGSSFEPYLNGVYYAKYSENSCESEYAEISFDLLSVDDNSIKYTKDNLLFNNIEFPLTVNIYDMKGSLLKSKILLNDNKLQIDDINLKMLFVTASNDKKTLGKIILK
jgi:hypothetical protein